MVDPVERVRRGTRRRARLGRGPVVLGAVVVVICAGGGVAWATSRSTGPTYRTATVSLADVTQTLVSVGTVGSVNKAVVTFPVSGRVATLPVGVGASVSAGEVVATLDATALTQQVTQARQTVADDQQKLANDQASQTASTTTATTTAATTTTATAVTTTVSSDSASVRALTAASPTPTPAPTRSAGKVAGTASPSAAGVSASVSAVRVAQAQLVKDQRALDAILTDGSLADVQALVATTGPCATMPPAQSTIVATTNAAGTLTVTTPAPASITAAGAIARESTHDGSGFTYTVTGAADTSYHIVVTPDVGAIDAATCTAAIQKVVAELDPSQTGSAWSYAQATNADELALAGAITRLETQANPSAPAGSTAKSGASGGGAAGKGSTSSRGSVGSSASGTNSSGSSASGTSAAGSSARGTGTGATTGTGAGTATASPQQLVADQAAIDAANAELAVTQQNAAQATIRSSISGTVAANGFTLGASAGSNSITVIGPGAEQVTTSVSLANLDLTKVGDPAVVHVDGVSSPITGRVTTIGMLNTTTGTTTTFPVTVLLDPSAAAIFDGSGASVAITVSRVSNVLTVPSSAVHTLGTLRTVTALVGGKSQTTRVTVGAIGTDLTQIRSGLGAGQRVILAQLNAPLPSSGTTTLRGIGGAGLGVTGGGLTGGGLTGGGLTGGGQTRTGG